jgi:hypothetical protein
LKSCTSGGRLPNHVITIRAIEELLEEEEFDLRYKQSDIRRSQNYDTNID